MIVKGEGETLGRQAVGDGAELRARTRPARHIRPMLRRGQAPDDDELLAEQPGTVHHGAEALAERSYAVVPAGSGEAGFGQAASHRRGILVVGGGGLDMAKPALGDEAKPRRWIRDRAQAVELDREYRCVGAHALAPGKAWASTPSHARRARAAASSGLRCCRAGPSTSMPTGPS